MPTLSTFIRSNTNQILVEWETFARGLSLDEPMDLEEIRDHAREMLAAIANDLETPQTSAEQAEKAKGESDSDERSADTAAQEHGAGRAESGFSIAQMVAEFRALRASVMRLWSRQQHDVGVTQLEDMTRFNEAIDQAIAESITRYTHEIGQSKERFLAILGHDLRSPLSAIVTASSFMLDTRELKDPHLTLVTRIASSARRMNLMVADLLEFTRTRFGDSIPIERADAHIGKVIDEVVAEVAASYPGSTVNVTRSGTLAGQWDADRLIQAFTNLVCNAVQHGSDKAPIDVSVRGEEREVLVSVHNDGEPIAEEDLAQIFEAMKHAGPESERDRRHLGLGLYIVDKIITGHGGKIDVSSSEKEGTLFTVHLPR